VLCVTDHCLRSDDPWLAPDTSHGFVCADNYNGYLSEIEAEAQRARNEYDLLVVPGLELTYNDLNPYLAAHAVAVGCRAFVSVDRGVDAALAHARGEGAALVAAHPFRNRRATPVARRCAWLATGAVAECGLPAVASGDFHEPAHLHGWKTLLPCAKEEAAVVSYLRSSRPAFLTRIAEPLVLRDAA
jgi:hypothetical protein